MAFNQQGLVEALVNDGTSFAGGALQRSIWGGEDAGILWGSLLTGGLVLGGFVGSAMSPRAPMLRNIFESIAMSGSTVAGWVSYEKLGLPLLGNGNSVAGAGAGAALRERQAVQQLETARRARMLTAGTTKAERIIDGERVVEIL